MRGAPLVASPGLRAQSVAEALGWLVGKRANPESGRPRPRGLGVIGRDVGLYAG